MERPEIAVENYKEVYNYYRQFEQPARVLKLVYAAFNGILHPRVNLADGAQDDLDLIKRETVPHFYIFNHLSRFDYFIFASTLHQIAPDDIGTIRTMGADFNFRWPQHRQLKEGRTLQMGAGPITDFTGGIPVFRSMEYPDVDLRPVQEELFNCIRDGLATGQKAAAAPEGKINYDNPATLLRFRSGVAEVIHRTTELLDREAGITPIGFCYKRDLAVRRNKGKNASVHIGRTLFVPPGMEVPTITERARTDLQHAVTTAHELY